MKLFELKSKAKVKANSQTTPRLAHALALFTITVWGLTFISTKILLRSFEPVEILFYRFFIGFCALWIIRPHILHVQCKKDHLWFVLAGLFGVCLYFLLENIALLYATASNISVTVSVSPMFIAIVATLVLKKRTLSKTFVAGFVLAMAGIILISISDTSTVHASFGDVLALLAALTWALYSNIINYLCDKGYDSIAVTKRCFAWGLLFILISMPLFGTTPFAGLDRFLAVDNWGNILFLGLFASAACFATWSYVVSKLGATKAGVYVYLSPGITVLAGVLVLGEAFTWRIALGIVLVLGGLILSELPNKKHATSK